MAHKFTRALEPIPALRGGGGPTERSDLRPDRIAHWAKVPKWTWMEAPALICGLEPDYACKTWSTTYSSPTRHLPHSQQAAYDDARRIIERAMPSGWRWRHEDAKPADWIALAKKYDVPIPPELEAEVAKWADEDSSSVNPTVVAKSGEPTLKQAEIIRVAKELWPDGCYPANREIRRSSLKEKFKEKGLSPPGDTNIWKAFKILERT